MPVPPPVAVEEAFEPNVIVKTENVTSEATS